MAFKSPGASLLISLIRFRLERIERTTKKSRLKFSKCAFSDCRVVIKIYPCADHMPDTCLYAHVCVVAAK